MAVAGAFRALVVASTVVYVVSFLIPYDAWHVSEKDLRRHLYLAMVPFSGFTVMTALESLLASIYALLDGAILTLAYLSPFAERFKRSG